jgi:hypothetical protein
MIRACPTCGREIQEPAPPGAGEALVTGPSFQRPFADIVFSCPACGADIDRARLYWGFATAQQVKGLVAGLVLAMLGVALFLVFRQ